MINKSIGYDELLLLGQAADQTCWQFETTKAKTGQTQTLFKAIL